jgi:hypothetical protein
VGRDQVGPFEIANEAAFEQIEAWHSAVTNYTYDVLNTALMLRHRWCTVKQRRVEKIGFDDPVGGRICNDSFARHAGACFRFDRS